MRRRVILHDNNSYYVTCFIAKASAQSAFDACQANEAEIIHWMPVLIVRH